MLMGGDWTWGGEHTVQCTDDVLWNCAPETCIILLTSVTPTNSIKKVREAEIQKLTFTSFIKKVYLCLMYCISLSIIPTSSFMLLQIVRFIPFYG